jgi:hypothetical protein
LVCSSLCEISGISFKASNIEEGFASVISIGISFSSSFTSISSSVFIDAISAAAITSLDSISSIFLSSSIL